MISAVQTGDWISPEGILMPERVPTLFGRVQIVSMADGDSGAFIGNEPLPRGGKWRGLWYDTLETAQGWMATNICTFFGQTLVITQDRPVYGLTTEQDDYGRYLMDLVVEWRGVLNGVAEAMIASGSAVLYHGLRQDDDPLRYKGVKPKLLPTRNSPRGKRLAMLEEMARESKFGLWAHDFVLPDLFRKIGRGELKKPPTWQEQLKGI